MSLSLLTRIGKGSPLNTSEHDTNLTDIETEVNLILTQLALSLTPTGVLQPNALNNANQIVDGIITLAKLADLTVDGVLTTDSLGRPIVLTGAEGQRLQFGTAGLEAYTPAEVDDVGKLLGIHTSAASLVIPDQGRDVRLQVTGSVLMRGAQNSANFVAKAPIRVEGGEIAACRWWCNEPDVNRGFWGQSTGVGTYFAAASVGNMTLDFGALTAEEGSFNTVPDTLTLSNHKIVAMVFAA